MKATIVGGGIIGLSTASYLEQSGWEVTVLDAGDFDVNCSYGNLGYICPSHFIPLATPGIVKKGLKWMFNSRSPFYVQPRLSRSLMDWGLKFMRSATAEKVQKAAIPLRDISLLSQQEYEQWIQRPGFDIAYRKNGILEMFQTAEYAHHAEAIVKAALEIGLQETFLLDKAALQKLEPGTEIKAIGAIHYRYDAQCNPEKLMRSLLADLRARKVNLVSHQELVRVEKKGKQITRLFTRGNVYEQDQVILATGSWSGQTARLFGASIPMVPGRGYTVTVENFSHSLNYPALLMEGRAGITPVDKNMLRAGGTMEVTPQHSPPRMNRVEGILQAVKKFYPEFDIPMPAAEKVWYGYRPCSADGLPYIGRTRHAGNLVMATGHSMLGISLGAGTGKLVDEIINDKPLSMDISPFNPDRFS